jgi:hypothetical protein
MWRKSTVFSDAILASASRRGDVRFGDVGGTATEISADIETEVIIVPFFRPTSCFADNPVNDRGGYSNAWPL